MKTKIKLGVVCLARKTFDYLAAKELYANILSDLELLEQTEVIAYKELVIEPEDAIDAGKYLYENNVNCITVK